MCKSILVIVLTVLCLVKYSTAEYASGKIDNDDTTMVKDNLSWSCVNNGSCIIAVTNNIFNKLKSRKSIDLGFIKIQPIEIKRFTGRSSSFLDFLSGNAVQMPIGPMVFNIQRSSEYDNYLEIALLKKSTEMEVKYS